MANTKNNRTWQQLSETEQQEAEALFLACKQQLTEVRKQGWLFVDLVFSIREKTRLDLKEIWRRLGKPYSYQHLAKMVKKLGHEDWRNPKNREGVTYTEAIEASEVHANMPKIAKDQTSPAKIARAFQQRQTDSRDLTRGLIEKDKDNKRNDAADKAGKAPQDILSICHNLDCRKVLEAQADHSIMLAWLDPCYANYIRNKDSSLSSDGHYYDGLRLEADNNKKELIVPIVVDLISQLPAKLDKGGCAIIWQAGLYAVDYRFLQAIHDNGLFAYDIPAIKGRTILGSGDNAFALQSERFLVVFRPDEHPLNRFGSKRLKDNLNMEDLIHDLKKGRKTDYWPTMGYAARVKSGAAELKSVHYFQKGEALCNLFLDFLTLPGDTVFDGFGCSGSMTIAALNEGRKAVYCETNQENYEWGVSRISAQTKKLIPTKATEATEATEPIVPETIAEAA